MFKKIFTCITVAVLFILTMYSVSLAGDVVNWEKIYQDNEDVLYIDNGSINMDDNGVINCVAKRIYRTKKNGKINGKYPEYSLSELVFTSDIYALAWMVFFDKNDNVIHEITKNNGKEFVLIDKITPDTFAEAAQQHCIEILKKRGKIK